MIHRYPSHMLHKYTTSYYASNDILIVDDNWILTLLRMYKPFGCCILALTFCRIWCHFKNDQHFLQSKQLYVENVLQIDTKQTYERITMGVRDVQFKHYIMRDGPLCVQYTNRDTNEPYPLFITLFETVVVFLFCYFLQFVQ